MKPIRSIVYEKKESMAKSKVFKIVMFIVIIAIVIAFYIFIYNFIDNTIMTVAEKTKLYNNFSPIRLILFVIMGMSISQILDKLLKKRVFFNNELFSRIIRFIAVVVSVILGLVLMLTNSILFYALPLSLGALFVADKKWSVL